MGKYFMQDTRHAAFERMMMEVPKAPGRPEPPKTPPRKKRGYAYRKKGVKKS